MKRSRYNIVIIEPSEIIVHGLRQIIGESGMFNILDTFFDIGGLQESNIESDSIDIAIINPSLISHGRRGSIRSILPDSKLVALLYSYIDKDTLRQFDSSIEVYDKISKIHYTLEHTVQGDKSAKGGAESGELSERELEILVAVAKGMINKEIADLYNISIHTVMAHRKNISRKTGIKSVSGFVVYALLNNLIEEYEVL